MAVNRRTIGIVMMIGGLALVLAGALGAITSGGESEPASTTSTSVAGTPTVTEHLASTTTTAPGTATTTQAATTTTAVDAGTAVLAFFELQVAAIESGDVDFLLSSLHPIVTDLYTAELCRSFIEREILALGDYQATGQVTGPQSQTFETGTADVYSLPTSFTFQGGSFDATATFAFLDGEVRWFTQCR